MLRPSLEDIRNAFLDALTRELETLHASYDNAVVGATHEESKAEDPKDMRSTEASYLARGLAERIQQKKSLKTRLERMLAAPQTENDKPSSGDVVLLTEESPEGTPSERLYFICDGLGGTQVQVSGMRFVAISPQAPLGKAISKARYGEEFEHPTKPDVTLSCRPWA